MKNERTGQSCNDAEDPGTVTFSEEKPIPKSTTTTPTAQPVLLRLASRRSKVGIYLTDLADSISWAMSGFSLMA